jgi:hypothetical protein
VFIRRTFSTSPRRKCTVSSAGKPLWGTELIIELGPALQRAHAAPLKTYAAPSELRRTLHAELRRTL